MRAHDFCHRRGCLTKLWPSLAALGAFISVMLVIGVSRVRKRLD